METALTQASPNRSNRATLATKNKCSLQEQELWQVKQPFLNAEAELATKKQQLQAGQAYRQGVVKYYASYSQYVDGLDRYREGVAALKQRRNVRNKGEIASQENVADGEAKLADAKRSSKESEKFQLEERDS